MAWFQQWRVLAARIDGLIRAGEFLVSTLKAYSSDNFNVVEKSILPELSAINTEIIELGNIYASELPNQAYKALQNYITQGWSNDLKVNIQIIVPLVAFRSQFEYLIRGYEGEGCSMKEPVSRFDIDITDKGIALSAELEKIEKIMIKKALQRTKGSKAKAAKLLNVTFDSFRYRMEKLGME